MLPSNALRSGGHRLCSHCQCSTVKIGSKLLSDYLNLGGPDIGSDSYLKPTILEAITLIFGFRMPPAEVVMNTVNGIQYFDSKGQSYQDLAICTNCESILINLYKVFLLFTELSNGRESFILKNSIISGRVDKEEEVTPLDSPILSNGYMNQSQLTISGLHTARPSVSTSLLTTPNSITRPSLTTIRRELSSDIIAEMVFPGQPLGVTITPVLTTQISAPQQSSGSQLYNSVSQVPSSQSTGVNPVPPVVPHTSRTTNPSSNITCVPIPTKSNPTNTKPVEIITLDEDDDNPTSSEVDTSSNVRKITHNGKRVPPLLPTPQRFLPLPYSGSVTTNPLKRPGARHVDFKNSVAKHRNLQRLPPLSNEVSSSNRNFQGPLAEKRRKAVPGATIIGTTPATRPGATLPRQVGSGHPSAVSVLSERQGLVTRTTTTTATHKCDGCPLHFPTLVELLSHVVKDHKNGQLVGRAKFFRCPMCLLEFGSASLLDSHLKNRHLQKPNTAQIISSDCRPKGNKKQKLSLSHRSEGEITGRISSTREKNGSINNLTTESESDYWTSGIQVIHDPEDVMRKLEVAKEERMKKNGTT